MHPSDSACSAARSEADQTSANASDFAPPLGRHAVPGPGARIVVRIRERREDVQLLVQDRGHLQDVHQGGAVESSRARARPRSRIRAPQGRGTASRAVESAWHDAFGGRARKLRRQERHVEAAMGEYARLDVFVVELGQLELLEDRADTPRPPASARPEAPGHRASAGRPRIPSRARSRSSRRDPLRSCSKGRRRCRAGMSRSPRRAQPTQRQADGNNPRPPGRPLLLGGRRGGQRRRRRRRPVASDDGPYGCRPPTSQFSSDMRKAAIGRHPALPPCGVCFRAKRLRCCHSWLVLQKLHRHMLLNQDRHPTGTGLSMAVRASSSISRI